MVALCREVDAVHCPAHVGGMGFAEIGVEVHETRDIHDDVELAPKSRGHVGCHPKPRRSHVALHDFDPLGEEARQESAVPLMQRLEAVGMRHHLLEALVRAETGVLARSKQYEHAADGRDAVQEHGEPHLANEPRSARHEQALARKRRTDRELRNRLRAWCRVLRVHLGLLNPAPRCAGCSTTAG